MGLWARAQIVTKKVPLRSENHRQSKVVVSPRTSNTPSHTNSSIVCYYSLSFSTLSDKNSLYTTPASTYTTLSSNTNTLSSQEGALVNKTVLVPSHPKIVFHAEDLPPNSPSNPSNQKMVLFRIICRIWGTQDQCQCQLDLT